MVDKQQLSDAMYELIQIFQRLRAPDGCPWDREQTHQTLRPYTIEEAYELAQAIDSKNTEAMVDELGDLLLHILFHCQLADEVETFNFLSVTQVLKDKLIRRHPHVFGDVTVISSDEVLKRWQQIKSGEQPSIPKDKAGLPSLIRAVKIQKKATQVGFDWKDYKGPKAKILEELDEIEVHVQPRNEPELETEIGDLLFSIVNLARHLNVDPEIVLHKASQKFEARFSQVQQKISETGKSLAEASLEEMDKIWDEIKRTEVI